MRTHPPLFTALCRRHGPQHAANVLARKLAHRENHLINRIMQTYARYYPPGWSDHHEKDYS